MFKTFYKPVLFVVLLATLANCANRGTPSGGEKDVEPPKIIRSVPENYTTNFKGKEIKIYFDEYVKIKDIQKQLIISPPMDPEPDITPLGTASKYITIKIKDTLEPNTTYAFNFGQSIVDNNEGNPYPYYKYVFSTGSFIDSLSVKGTIIDAESNATDTFVSVMLYEADSTYTDSIVYKKKPKYVTNTLDSITTFSIDNIKAGKYRLVALKDENKNYTYQPKTDKIGFYDAIITVPTDTLYTIKLFKENLDFKAFKPKQIAGQKIAFGFEGDYKNMKIKMLSPTPEGFESRITKDKKADSLYYWYKPKLELDSTFFVVRNKAVVDTLLHRFRDLEKDSLTIKSVQTGSLKYDENFQVEGSIPFAKINEQYISILDKDSLSVLFKTELDSLKNQYTFKFDKKEDNTYKVQMLPDAFTDFFGNVNDTLNFSLKTKPFSDLSDVRVTLVNAVYPLITQLVDDKGEVKYEIAATKPQVFDFRHITPGTYYLRVIFDTNGNQKWDTGNFLKREQPERISYYPDMLDARTGWDLVQEFTLEKTSPDLIKN